MSDMSISGAVYDLLHRQNKEAARVFRAAEVHKSGSTTEELHSLNQYMRIQLGKAPVDTLDERGCLADDLSPTMWLKYFEVHVLPTLVRFNLPSE